MEKNIANELKKLDIEIAKKLFSISKEKNIIAPPSPLQGRILDYLLANQEKEINQKDLEKALNVSKATVSGALFSMEKNNIIRRITSKSDSRSKQIVITEETMKTRENLKIVFESLNKKLTKNISEQEIETFYNILEKLRKNLR